MSNDFYTNSILPYAGIIIKICRAYSNSQEDFEDYYQEVCLQIWRSRNNFNGKSKWSTWVYKISLNVSMTLRRKEDKRSEQRLSTYDVIETNPSNNGLPIFQDEPLSQLYAAIKQLSDIDRAIVILYLEERSYKEIGEIIGTTSNNIGVRIQRIKKRLKKLILKTNNHE